MSLHTIVSDGLLGRFQARRTVAVAQPRTTELGVRVSGASMRLLETGFALTAIAVALLIGLGR